LVKKKKMMMRRGGGGEFVPVDCIWSVQVQFCSFPTSALDRDEWSNLTLWPSHFTPVKNPHTYYPAGWVDASASLVVLKTKIRYLSDYNFDKISNNRDTKQILF
jgi:hypothetical protein